MAPNVEFRPEHVDRGDGAALAQAMREEIELLYDGLQLDGPDMPKAGPDELSPPHGTFVVGRIGDLAVCCGGVKRLEEGACEIKKMFVTPRSRGQGVARVLLHELEDRARRLGYTVARLDTGPRQEHARRLYLSEGYAEIPNFNGNPMATFFAEKAL